jgi:hypothetical protein
MFYLLVSKTDYAWFFCDVFSISDNNIILLFFISSDEDEIYFEFSFGEEIVSNYLFEIEETA